MPVGEVLNFGFSGNCMMQEEVADLLLELKPSVFVIDCLPNMGAATVTERATPVFKQLREKLGPDVPMLVLEGHTYSVRFALKTTNFVLHVNMMNFALKMMNLKMQTQNAWVLPSIASAQAAKRTAQKAAFDEQAKTDKNIHYMAGDAKLASLGEGQYDATSGIGVHPTNIAHLHIAQAVAAAVKPLL